MSCWRSPHRSRPASVDHNQQLLDVTLRHDAGIAPLQLALHIEFVPGLLQVGCGLLGLGLRLCDVDFRCDELGVDLGDLAFGGLECGLLLGAIEREQHVALLDRRAVVDLHFTTRPVLQAESAPS